MKLTITYTAETRPDIAKTSSSRDYRNKGTFAEQQDKRTSTEREVKI